MGKYKFIPKEEKNGYLVLCLNCIHKNKCIYSNFVQMNCGSFTKRAGIRKGFRRRNGKK